MRLFLPFCLLTALCAFGQQQPLEIVTITPDTVIAVLNGEKFTAGDFERISQGLSPQLRTLAAADPTQFLLQYAHSLMLASEGEKAKLHESFPYRERIADARKQILADAIIAHRTASATVDPEEVRKRYDDNQDEYREAFVKVIFLSRIAQITNIGEGSTKSLSMEEIKAKAGDVAKKAKEGSDFVKLAKEHSDDRTTAEKDADLPYPIRGNASNIPADMRKAILASKVGEVIGPLEHQTGFYIFRVESQQLPPFEALRKDIEKELKAEQVQKWVDELKAKSTVKLENDAFWTTFKSANQRQQPEEGGAEPQKDAGSKAAVPETK